MQRRGSKKHSVIFCSLDSARQTLDSQKLFGSVVFKRVCYKRLFADNKAGCVDNTCGQVVLYRVYHPMETRRRVLFLEKKRQNSTFRSEALMAVLGSFPLHAGAGADVNSRKTSIILFVLSADPYTV